MTPLHAEPTAQLSASECDRPLAHPVVVAGGGAAGRAAAQELVDATSSSDRLRIVHLTGPAEEAIDRTMVDKAIMTGRLSPERAAAMRPPLEGVETRHDTVVSVAEAPATSSARLRLTLGTGDVIDSAGFVLATGSKPRRLDVPGAREWEESGRLTTLHSVNDAVRIKDQLDGVDGARVLVTGSGLVGAEAASLLCAAGHRVTLVARSQLPGASAFGVAIAERLAAIHEQAVATRWGVRILELGDGIAVVDDGTAVEADLVIVAHGAVPALPAGVERVPGVHARGGVDGLDESAEAGGVLVDGGLRVCERPAGAVAAGAVAEHTVRCSTYRVDHWDDAEAQGAHAARTLLADLGVGEEARGAEEAEGRTPYVPRSPWSARLHGRQLAGFGHPLPGSIERTVTEEPLLVEFVLPGEDDGSDGQVCAVIGLDAGRALRDHARAAFEG